MNTNCGKCDEAVCRCPKDAPELPAWKQAQREALPVRVIHRTEGAGRKERNVRRALMIRFQRRVEKQWAAAPSSVRAGVDGVATFLRWGLS